MLCGRVNSVLCSSIGTGKFVTLFYGVLDAERRRFEYTNAGHLLPILIRAGGDARPLQHGGAVLGVLPEWKYENSNVPLNPGDRLLLFTDGITEAALPGGEEFGDRRLVEAAQKYVNRSIGEMKSLLLTEVKQFCDSELQDDATLIVISALPARKQSEAKSQECDTVTAGQS